MSLTAVTKIPAPAAPGRTVTPYLVLNIEEAVGRYPAVRLPLVETTQPT